MPVALSISYLTVSVGTISMYAVTQRGASSPMGTSCHGWAHPSRAVTSRRYRGEAGTHRRSLVKFVPERILALVHAHCQNLIRIRFPGNDCVLTSRAAGRG